MVGLIPVVSEADGDDEAVSIGWSIRGLQEHWGLCGLGLSLTKAVLRFMKQYPGGTALLLVEFKFGRTSMSADITSNSEEGYHLVFRMPALSSAVFLSGWWTSSSGIDSASGTDRSKCSNIWCLSPSLFVFPLSPG